MDLEKHWYSPKRSLLAKVLWPLAVLFRVLVWLRRALYRAGFLTVHALPVPVIVVGNITVGGTGKTPFVIALCAALQKKGFKPGIVSRGVGGVENRLPFLVDEASAVKVVGDEAVLMRHRTDCPVVVGKDRVAAVALLLKLTDCDIVISDDGLQHYRLGRNVEILMVDGMRRFGNGLALPAGPLREPLSRLSEVDFVVWQNGGGLHDYQMMLKGDVLHHMVDGSKKSVSDFKGMKIHAVAGIGNPCGFFQALRGVGLDVIEHVFPDHYHYRVADFVFADDLVVVMTEKDAVKVFGFADDRFWFLPVDAVLVGGFDDFVEKVVVDLKNQ